MNLNEGGSLLLGAEGSGSVIVPKGESANGSREVQCSLIRRIETDKSWMSYGRSVIGIVLLTS